MSVVEKKGLIGGGTREESLAPLTVDVDGDDDRPQAGRSRRGPVPRNVARPDRLVQTCATGRRPRKVDAARSRAAAHPSPRSEFLIGDRTSWWAMPPGVVVDVAGGAPAAAVARRGSRASTTSPATTRPWWRCRPRSGTRASRAATRRAACTSTTARPARRSCRSGPRTAVQSLAFAPKADALLVADGRRTRRAVADRQPAPRGHASRPCSARSGTRDTRRPTTSGSPRGHR